MVTNVNSFREANASLVESGLLTATKATKSQFSGTVFHNGDIWTLVRSAWLLKPGESEASASKLFPGFIVANATGREEILFLSTLLRPETSFEGDEIPKRGTANRKALEIFEASSSDDEALQNILAACPRIKVRRETKFNAYIKTTGKERPNSLLLEFDLA